MAALLEELMTWLTTAEETLKSLETSSVPDDLSTVEGLIREHKAFMEDTAKRQSEVDRVCMIKQQLAGINALNKDCKTSQYKLNWSVLRTILVK